MFSTNKITSLPFSICNLQLIEDPDSQKEFGSFVYVVSSLSGYEYDLRSWRSALIYYSTINQINSREDTVKMKGPFYCHFKTFLPKELCDIIFTFFTKVTDVNDDDRELLSCYRNKTIIRKKILTIDTEKKIAYLEKKPK